MGTPTKFIQKLFAKKQTPEKASTSDAIRKLKMTEEMLTKKSEFLESKIIAELEVAKTNGTKNKRVALQALQRKHRHEKSLKQIDNTLTTLEVQREALENADCNSEVLRVLGYSANTLQGMHKTLDVTDATEILDDASDQLEMMSEINDLISSPVGPRQQLEDDEDELLLELELMEKEQDEKYKSPAPHTTDGDVTKSGRLPAMKENSAEVKKGSSSRSTVRPDTNRVKSNSQAMLS